MTSTTMTATDHRKHIQYSLNFQHSREPNNTPKTNAALWIPTFNPSLKCLQPIPSSGRIWKKPSINMESAANTKDADTMEQIESASFWNQNDVSIMQPLWTDKNKSFHVEQKCQTRKPNKRQQFIPDPPPVKTTNRKRLSLVQLNKSFSMIFGTKWKRIHKIQELIIRDYKKIRHHDLQTCET